MVINFNTEFTKTIKLWSHLGVQGLHPYVSLPTPLYMRLQLDRFLTLWGDTCLYRCDSSFEKVTILVLKWPLLWPQTNFPDNVCVVRSSKKLRKRTNCFQSNLSSPSLPSVSFIRERITNLIDSGSTYCTRLLLVTTFNLCPLSCPSFKPDWVSSTTQSLLEIKSDWIPSASQSLLDVLCYCKGSVPLSARICCPLQNSAIIGDPDTTSVTGILSLHV